MTRRNRRSRRGFTFAELLVVVLLLALIFGAVLPACARRQYGGSNRVKCASNLRQIGQAILLYCNENGGKYPRLLDTTGPVVTPTWGTGAAAANPWGKGRPQNTDVTAALFLLLRTQDITSEVFVCPSSYAERDTFGDALSRSNFSDVKKNLSYSYQNPYPNDGALERKWKLDKNISAEYAVASDINPGTAGIDQNVLAVVVTMSAKEMKQGNSFNHDADGQNVLYGDNHVEWQQNPFVGVNRDNIFTASDGKGGNVPTLLASPWDVNDSILLPTDD